MPIKCRKTCVSDAPEYKTVANACNFALKTLLDTRKATSSPSVRRRIIVRIHTLLIIRWMAAKRFGVDSESIAKDIKGYYKARHIKEVDELYLLRHYVYGDDLNKYQQEFQEEFNYELEKI